MIRIELQDRAQQMVIKVEGDVAGIFAGELEQIWRDLAHSRQPLTLDLNGVIHIDQRGRLLLRSMYAAGVGFVGSQMALQDVLD